MSSKKREQFVEAAAALFVSRGYDRVGLDDVVKATASSRSVLYYHFKAKQELWLAAVEARRESLRQAWAAARSAATAVEQLTAYGAAFHRHGTPLLTLMTGTPTELTETIHTVLIPLFEQCEADLVDCLTRGMASGELRPTLPPEFAMRLFLRQMQSNAVYEGEDTTPALIVLLQTDPAPSVSGSGTEVPPAPGKKSRRLVKRRSGGAVA